MRSGTRGLAVHRLQCVKHERPLVGGSQPAGFLPLAQPVASGHPGPDRRTHVRGKADRAYPPGDHAGPGVHRHVNAVRDRAIPEPARHHLQQGQQRRLRHRHRPAGQVSEHRQFRPQPDPRIFVQRPLRNPHIPQRAWPAHAVSTAGDAPRLDDARWRSPQLRQPCRRSSCLPRGAVRHPGQQREVHAVREHGGLARPQRDQVPALRVGGVHRRADDRPVIRGGQPVGDLH
jgi:hypothetical protein